MGGSSRRHIKHGKRTNFERARDLAEIGRLYLLGRPQHEIALEIGQLFYDNPKFLSRTTIGKDIAEIRGNWLAQASEAVEERVAIELAKIDNLESEYWRGWERSQKDSVITTVSEKDDSSDKTVKTYPQTGDPRYLDGILKCVERRCKLFGLDRPAKLDVAGIGKSPIPVRVEFDPASLSDEELMRVISENEGKN